MKLNLKYTLKLRQRIVLNCQCSFVIIITLTFRIFFYLSHKTIRYTNFLSILTIISIANFLLSFLLFQIEMKKEKVSMKQLHCGVQRNLC